MWYNNGTIDVTNGSPIITGNGTVWTFNITVGDILLDNGSVLYEILTVDSDTQVTLASNYLGSTQSAISYDMIRNVVTNSNLAARITNVVSHWQLREDQIEAWQGGTALGGPNLDGKYPLSDPDDVIHMIDCPAAIAAYAGGGSQEWANTPEDVLVPTGTQHGIDAVNVGGGTFTITDTVDYSSDYTDGSTFQIINSTGNDGIYTVASTSWSTPDFIITVTELISDGTADGVISNDYSSLHHAIKAEASAQLAVDKEALVSPHYINIDKVGTDIDNVNLVGDDIDNVNTNATYITNINTNATYIGDIQTVATDLDLGLSSNIEIVALDIDNVNLTGASITNVNFVGNDIDHVNTVATDLDLGLSSNIELTALNIGNVNLTGASITDVNDVAGSIGSVNTNATYITNINTNATYIDNINDNALYIANINTNATNIADIQVVATDLNLGLSSNIEIVALDIDNVNFTGGSITNVNLTGASITDVNDVAGSIGSVNNVSTNIADVNTNATNIADIQVIATDLNLGLNSNIEIVALDIDNVNLTGASITNVNLTGGSITNVNLTGGSIGNVNIVGDEIGSVFTVATDLNLGVASNIELTALNITNVNFVGGSITSVNTVAPHVTNIDTVAPHVTNIGTVAPHVANIDTVAPHVANIDTVAPHVGNIDIVSTDLNLGASSNINLTGGSITNVNLTGGSIASVNTVATNIAIIQSVNTNIVDIQNAEANALEAFHWAQYTEDVKVPEGVGQQFSAYHWAKKAELSATGSLVYMGSWDASTTAYPVAPTLGNYWKIGTEGTISGTLYKVGDSIIFNDTTWDHIDNTELVTAVAGKTGDVDLVQADIAGLHSNSNVTFNTLNCQIAQGTAPFTVASTTKVINLNADQLDSLGASSFLRSDAIDSFTTLSGTTLGVTSDLNVGTAAGVSAYLNLYGTNPGAKGTMRTTADNLHIDAAATGAMYLNWYTGGDIFFGDGAGASNANINSAGRVKGTTFESTVAIGTAPITVTSTTQCPNLNASYLGGAWGWQYLRSDEADSFVSLAGTGHLSVQDYVQSGLGTGGVALTHNDGYGNANVTFNHMDGIPEQDGNSARIEVNTDTSSDAHFSFEVLSATTTAGGAQALNQILKVGETYITAYQNITAPQFNGALNGNASGSSSSCTGNAATTTLAADSTLFLGMTKFNSGSVQATETIPTILASNGVMDIGRYIDFHTTGSTSGFDMRFNCTTDSNLTLAGGSLTVTENIFADYMSLGGSATVDPGSGDLRLRRTNNQGALFFGDDANTYIYVNSAQMSFKIAGATADLSANLLGNATTATDLASIPTNFSGVYPACFNVAGAIYSDAAITFDGTTNTLSAANFSGYLVGNADSATLAASVTVTASTTSTWYDMLFRNGSSLYSVANVEIQASTGSIRIAGSLEANSGILLEKVSNNNTGISYYSTGHNTWTTYMADSGTTLNGPRALTTASTGSEVTSWALRSFIEDQQNYGWIWEGGDSVGQPSVVAELSSYTGNFKTKGQVKSTGSVVTDVAGTEKVEMVWNATEGSLDFNFV